jgi:molybdopterin synthase catalytic subunit
LAIRDIWVGEAAIDPAALHEAFLARHGGVGAVVSFTGAVREHTRDGAVDHLWLDWYPGMTEASVAAIAQDAESCFAPTVLTIHHRAGRIAAGEAIVFVAAASPHRRAAFEAADYVMDRLKSEAAFWKRESGEAFTRWVEPTAQDRDDLNRWSKG